MIEKLKEYWIIISSALVAIFYLILKSKNKELAELRYERTFNKFDGEVKKLESKIEQGDHNVKKTLEKYRAARSKYDALKSKYGTGPKSNE